MYASVLNCWYCIEILSARRPIAFLRENSLVKREGIVRFVISSLRKNITYHDIGKDLDHCNISTNISGLSLMECPFRLNETEHVFVRTRINKVIINCEFNKFRSLVEFNEGRKWKSWRARVECKVV